MKLSHFYKFLHIIILSFVFFTFKIFAFENIDERVKKLTAEFSNDIKKIVKNKLKAGESERDIKKFLVERYGEYILFRPLMNYNNIFLWSFPFILLIIGLFFVLIKTKTKKA